MKFFTWLIAALLTTAAVLPAAVADEAPWGHAKPVATGYAPQKVLYDLSSGSERELVSLLDRVSYLATLYGSDPFDMSVVVIVHAGAIPFFTIGQFEKYRETITRAQSLTVGNPVEFRMCQAAARVQGLAPEDIHGFVKMVPMADAEIIRLQNEEGYAYMQ